MCALALLGLIPARAQTATEVVLYNFGGGTDGDQPVGGVISDQDGNLYGTTYYGGTHGNGVVYKLDTTGQYTKLHNFMGGPGGGNPFAGVVRDPAGNLYGTTLYGGPASAGVVYKVDAAGQYSVLHGFTRGTDGGLPYAGLTLDPAGNLYGTASSGGIINSTCISGCGVVFTVDATGRFRVLHSFTGADGDDPHAGVILDPAGNIYGTTYDGGASGGGVVYELNPAGQVTVLYNFTGGADGGQPSAGVIHDSDGVLFGTTFGGGASSYGTVYRLDTAGKETVLHSFPGGGQGRQPAAGVIQDPVGNLYGTTPRAGAAGCGVVYKLDPPADYTVLYSFKCGSDGRQPDAGVIRDSAGNLYGTTIAGGKYSFGVVFKLELQ
jgi:uncharacterized repeat protein (TIGR03803 family)